MTARRPLSANIPRSYLFDREWRAMPDDARTLWVSACQLCIGETNGYLSCEELGLLLPVDAARRQVALEWLLASKGKFRFVPHTRDGGGWKVSNWTSHNSTVETVEKNRKKWREDKRRQRAQAKADAKDEGMSTGGLHGGSKDKDKGFAVRESNHVGTLTVEQPPDGRVTS